MSRFVRASKYRHVFGQTGKKEFGIENAKVSNSAWDTNMISASGSYISLNWNASGGGAFAILPLPNPFRPIPDFPFKLPDVIPLARGHTAPVLDTDWNPFDDSVVASGGEDGKLLIWKVDESQYVGWGAEKWVPRDFEPVARVDASPKKIGQVLFHPTASHVIATASGEHVVKIWDLNNWDDPRIALSGHTDTIQGITWNPAGTLIATTCRDRKLRLFDPRASPEPVRITDGHGGIKGARVTWMGENNLIATTGFSKMSDRQVAVWETGGLGNIKNISLDQSSGVVMPFWSDNGILFLAGKGDGNIRYFEWESDTLYPLAEHKSSEPQRGMCFLPRRALNVAECEIARAYKVSGSLIEPIAFVVPRRADSFQSDIFPPAPSAEPAVTASEFFQGKPITPNLVSLENGAVSAAPSTFTTPMTRVDSLPPTKSASALSPESAYIPPTPAKGKQDSLPLPSPAPVSASLASSPVPPSPAPISPSFDAPVYTPDAGALEETGHLKEEVNKLESELRDARATIRHLELQVESMRANAQRAARALLEGQ